MSIVTVAKVDKFQRFNNVTVRHFEEVDYTGIAGFVFHRDREDNPVVTFMYKNGCEDLYRFDDLAYVALDTETDETETSTEKPEEYTTDDIVSYILNAYKRDKIKYVEIKNGTVYSFLSGRFPEAPMSLCFKAVMKAWEDILTDDTTPIDYGEDK